MVTQEYLIVDGYNIIFAWDDLRALAQENLEAARTKLADILCNYQGFKKIEIILVFDGYKTKGSQENIVHYNNIDIVYTKEAQTADQFIERIAQEMGRQCTIRVATSDGVEQIIILGRGAARMSARELKIEIEEAEKEIRNTYLSKRPKNTNRLFDNVSPEMARLLEDIRLNRHKGE